VSRGAANRLPRWFVAALATTPTIFLLVFYAWPFATLLTRGLRLTAVSDTLRADSTWRVVWFTLWQAVLSTVATLVLGMFPAWAVARYAFPGRRLLTGALTAVFVLPTVVVGAAFVALLPDSLDRSVWAIIAAHVVFNLAVVVRTVGASWSQLPYDLEHAAARQASRRRRRPGRAATGRRLGNGRRRLGCIRVARLLVVEDRGANVTGQTLACEEEKYSACTSATASVAAH